MKLKASCSTEFIKELLERGFNIALVGISLKRESITSPNIIPFERFGCLECVTNVEDNFPDPKMTDFLYAHREEFLEYTIGSLPF